MSRVWLIPVVAVVSVLAPAVAQAQYAVVSPCGYDCARISIIPAPPTELPAWLQPRAVPPPVVAPNPFAIAPPVYVAPPPSRGIDPWIPLAVRPAPVTPAGDLLNQMLLMEALAAARDRRQAAPALVVPAPAPVPTPKATGDGWMSAYMKGVK